MPQVPDVEQRVTPSGYANVMLGGAPTAEVLGKGVADTGMHLGAQLYARHVQEANETALFDADAKLATLQTDLETKAQDAQGADVLGVSKRVQDDWTKRVGEIAEELPNERVKEAYGRRVQQRWAQLYRTTERLTTARWNEYQDKSTVGTVESVIDRIRRVSDGSPDMRDALISERVRGAEALRAYGERKGLTGIVSRQMLDDPSFVAQYTTQGLPVPAEGARYASPQYQRMQDTFTSRAHREVINGLLAKDLDQEAQRYFTANRAEIQAQDLDAVEKVVLEGSLRGQSQREVQRIQLTTGGMATAEQRRAQFELAKEIKDPKLADAVTDRLRHEHDTFDRLQAQSYADSFIQSNKLIDERWNDNAFYRKEAREMLSPAAWQALKPADQHALELKLERLRKPETRTHDDQAWLTFSGISREKLAAMPAQALLRDYLNRFDAAHYDRAIAEWQAARGIRDKGEREEKSIKAITDRELIHNTWVESGIAKDPGKLSPEEKVLYARWESRAAQLLSALPKDAPMPKVQDELNKLKDELLLMRLKAPGAFWGWMDKEIRGIQIPDVPEADQSKLRIPYDQLSPADVERYKGALLKAGATVTKEKIEQLAYREWLSRRKGKPNGR